MEKGKAMLEARPQFASQLDFVQIEDFEKTTVFDEAVKDVDAVIHVASVCFPPKIKETPSIESLLLIIFAAIYL
jgi:hypothetical protein